MNEQIKPIINKYQIAIFPNNFFSENLIGITEKINNKISIFNGTNSVLPVPPNAPRDIPRILLRSEDNSIRCDISFDKINLVWSNRSEAETFNISISERLSIAETVIDACNPGETIKRIGWITEFFYETENFVQNLSPGLIAKKVLENINNLYINFEYRLSLNSFSNCNQVVTLGNGFKDSGNKGPVVLLTNDINTHQSENVNWRIEKIKEFASEAEKLSNTEMLFKKYFS